MNEQRGVGYRESFLKVESDFKELMDSGGATPDNFKAALFKVLRSFETVRRKNNNQISNLESEIAFCQATSRACDMFENILVGIIRTIKNEVQGGLNVDVPEHVVSDPPKDTDVLKTICLCGCLDEIDAADCQCICHTKGFCDRPDCTVCRAKEVAAEEEKKSKSNGKSKKRPGRKKKAASKK